MRGDLKHLLYDAFDWLWATHPILWAIGIVAMVYGASKIPVQSNTRRGSKRR